MSISKGFFDGAEMDVSCPNCGYKVKKTLGWLKSSPEWTCSGCGKVVKIEASDVARGVKEMEESIADLERAFKKFGK